MIVHNVIHADDSPHVLALGVAVGVFIAFLPIVGIQTFVAIGIAALIGANKAIGVPIVWITNPLTIGPIYYSCWQTGLWALRSPAGHGQGRIQELQRLASDPSILDMQYWSELVALLMGVGRELWIGCLIISLSLSIPSYFIARRIVAGFRARRATRKQSRKRASTAASATPGIPRQSEPV